ncbi:DMT family transporter [Sulfitobacter guttiformis]|uniref:EamA-like transporter family protein n=1 Tax=Sulfitobacter guttiformis TaxID=74349 RepID=A0A420DJZ1_9RHOB|nr:DMT family transporter [Sulfitobacter guttiformis]KIN71606.1 Integral membrane protein [Sulfitobacter guttiformis KCTC 32187]RKE94560.1 EamA-like transporter family protein [Sulfitobacter guttiformis]
MSQHDLSRRDILLFSGFLVLMGAGWGATQPLTKIAVSTGYGPFGLLVWQQALGAILMLVVCAVRGVGLPRHTGALRAYLAIALIGAVLPNSISYSAAVHLPAGIMSLLLSIIPMFAFCIALLLRNDSFAWRRLAGLCFGLVGVMIVIVPSVDLGEAVPVGWAAVYLVVAMFYAFEGNYVAKWGVAGLDPFQLMLGASLAGLVIVAPVMLMTDQTVVPQWPVPKPQLALAAASLIHVLVYASYVWLVGRAGAVFAVQVSYMVTGFGLFWAWLVLGEAFSSAIWLALAAMFAGMYLVQPRPKAALEAVTTISDT